MVSRRLDCFTLFFHETCDALWIYLMNFWIFFISYKILYLRCHFRPFIFDILFLYIFLEATKRTCIIFLWPMCQPYSTLKSIQSPSFYTLPLECSRNHRYRHSQSRQLILILLFKLLARIAYLTAMKRSWIKKDHITCWTSDELPLRWIWISSS